MDYWSIGPLVECQMLNVDKGKLLSERTSGVPPVIFLFCSREELAEGSLRSPGLVLEAQNVVRRGSGERRKEIEHDTVKDVGNNNEDQVPQKEPR